MPSLELLLVSVASMSSAEKRDSDCRSGFIERHQQFDVSVRTQRKCYFETGNIFMYRLHIKCKDWQTEMTDFASNSSFCSNLVSEASQQLQKQQQSHDLRICGKPHLEVPHGKDEHGKSEIAKLERKFHRTLQIGFWNPSLLESYWWFRIGT